MKGETETESEREKYRDRDGQRKELPLMLHQLSIA